MLDETKQQKSVSYGPAIEEKDIQGLRSGEVHVFLAVTAGVLADLDPPRIGPPGPNPLADMDPPGPYPLADLDPRGPYPLADLDPPPRIWTP